MPFTKLASDFLDIVRGLEWLETLSTHTNHGTETNSFLCDNLKTCLTLNLETESKNFRKILIQNNQGDIQEIDLLSQQGLTTQFPLLTH